MEECEMLKIKSDVNGTKVMDDIVDDELIKSSSERHVHTVSAED